MKHPAIQSNRQPQAVSGLRRRLVMGAGALVVSPFCAPLLAAQDANAQANEQLAELERSSGGRLGVAAAAAGGFALSYRSQEPFPMCSTFKFLLAAAFLKQSETQPALLAQALRYSKKDLIANSPVSQARLAAGQAAASLTVAELCAATIQVSDNTAANLLLNRLGGPQKFNAYLRSLGDQVSRLDRIEPQMSTAIPGDSRDTSSPLAMANNLQTLLLGSALAEPGRTQLRQWMLGTTTGDTRIRAGVPQGWAVANKTGTGSYGTINDVGMLYPPSGPPIALAIYLTQTKPDAPTRPEVIAAATRLVVQAMAGAKSS
jgi:beta-lactamase class A